VLIRINARRIQAFEMLRTVSGLRLHRIENKHSASAPLSLLFRSKWRFGSHPIQPTCSFGAWLIAETANSCKVGGCSLGEIIESLPHFGSISNCHCSPLFNERSRRADQQDEVAIISCWYKFVDCAVWIAAMRELMHAGSGAEIERNARGVDAEIMTHIHTMIPWRIVSGRKNCADIIAELSAIWDVNFGNQARTILGFDTSQVNVASNL
jgi:hypothetical protein